MSYKARNTIYYDTSEVATVIDRSVKTTQGRIKAGLIVAEKIKGNYHVSREDLVKYLNEELILPEETIDLRLYKEPIRATSQG